MELTELIGTRRSVRTFDGKKLSAEHREKLEAYAGMLPNPYGIPIKIVLLDKESHGLSSPVISGETLYAAGKVEAVAHSEEAFGYVMEQFVLYAWSLGIGTTWIGGTMKREAFERAVQLRDGERMYCVSPLGYPAQKMSLREVTMRSAIKADKRLPAEKLFFDTDFSTPLADCSPEIRRALEAVRLAPSAVNKQPWRIVRAGERFHFYEKHNIGYTSESAGDMQKIDMGIALCHFLRMTDGSLIVSDPGIPVPKDTEYIATVTVSASAG